MNEALSSLAGTAGVRGFAVLDNSGTCISKSLPPPYEAFLVEDAAKRIAATANVFGSMDEGLFNGFVLNCTEGNLVFRLIDQFIIMALTEPTVNPNILHVAFNVVASNLNRSSSSEPAERISWTDSYKTPPEITSPSIDTSEALSSSASISSHDAVPRIIIQELLRIYVNYLGPAAKTVLKAQLSDLGATSRTLHYLQFDELVIRLTRKIPSAERQKEFQQAAQQLAKRISL